MNDVDGKKWMTVAIRNARLANARRLAEKHKTTAATVIDAALRQFDRTPPAERRKLIQVSEQDRIKGYAERRRSVCA